MSKATAIRLVYFLVFCCTGAWLPKLYDYCLFMGLSGTQAALILSITPVMMFAVQPLYGFLADRLGYKKTLLVASFLSALTYFGYLYDGGTIWIIGVTIIMSAFYNTVQPVLDSMALQLANTNPDFSYGNLRVFGAIGWAVTTIITGQLVDAVNMSAIFIVSGITMLLAFACSFFLADAPTEKTSSGTPGTIWVVVKNRSLLMLLLCVFIVSVGATTIWNYYSTYLKDNGATDSLVGYGLSFQGLCEIPLFYLSARIILKWGLKTTLLVTILATVIRLFLYHFIKNPYAALPVELLHGFSWSLFWVVCVEYVARLINEKWLATGQSLLYAAYFGIGAVAGNYWTEHFISKGWKTGEVFLVNAGLVTMAAVIAVIFIRQNPAGRNSV